MPSVMMVLLQVAKIKNILTEEARFVLWHKAKHISFLQSIMMVPLQVDKIENICTEKARFVLVVEKDATFQRLLDDGFVENMPCIMITVV